MKLIYVNKDLKIARSQEERAAVVNEYFADWVEIVFLQPVAHNQLAEVCSYINSSWCKENYPQYVNTAKLPDIRTYMLVNKTEKRLVFTKCMSCTKKYASKERIRSVATVDECGKVGCAVDVDMIQNIYPAFVMAKKDFLHLNPNILLEEYDFYHINHR